jgi:hypothetical protein
MKRMINCVEESGAWLFANQLPTSQTGQGSAKTVSHDLEKHFVVHASSSRLNSGITLVTWLWTSTYRVVSRKCEGTGHENVGLVKTPGMLCRAILPHTLDTQALNVRA